MKLSRFQNCCVGLGVSSSDISALIFGEISKSDFGSPSVPHIEVKVTAYAEEVQRVGEENPLVFHLIFVGMCICYLYLAFVSIVGIFWS